jgi:hypothetical protein
MTESEAKVIDEVVAAFSTVIVETTRAIARNSGGKVNRHLIAVDIQKRADNLPPTLGAAKAIMSNIACGLDDKPVTPYTFRISGSNGSE